MYCVLPIGDDESELLLPFSLDPIVMATTYPMEDFWDRLSTLPLGEQCSDSAALL